VTFTSFKFLLILPLLVALYQIVPVRWRVLFLLLVSYGYVCTFSVRAALMMAVATGFTFVAGKFAGDTSNQKRSYTAFLCAISALTLYLVFYKAVAVLPLGRFGKLAAPLGLSYYTFKLMSYVIDVYWGRIEPARGLTEFAAGIAFFPQIAAGPIQRPADFLTQVPPARTALWLGLSRLVWGLAKKVLVADNLAPTVNYVFAHVHGLHGVSLLAGFYLFPLQMYADFSALTDVALGMGMMFGILGPENFNRPFTASSISDFWRRWHMSLTNWLVDYVFTPLRMATRSVGTAGLALSITLNMLGVGLWHGFTRGYFVFGLLNAAYLVGDALTTRTRKAFFKARPVLDGLGSWAGWLLTLHLFFIAMVFFRSKTISDGVWLLSHAWTGLGTLAVDLRQLVAVAGLGTLLLGLAGYAVLELAERFRPDLWWSRVEDAAPGWVRWPVRCAVAACLVAALFLLTVRPGSQESAFLYQVF
jgi:D-alanyl-lipoteichoic acid acyltransferase DltB (MBOAT superfamily)